MEPQSKAIALAFIATLVLGSPSSATDTPLLFERNGRIWGLEQEAVCLTANQAGEQRSPAWNPKHEHWAFLQILPGQSQIWVRTRDGGQLYVGPCSDTARDLTWGEDGVLYYTHTQYGRNGAVQFIRKRGAFSGLEQDLLYGAIESHPSVSRGKLIWSRGRQGPWQIWIANGNGEAPKVLLEGHCAEPRWSPDGTRIAYSSNRSGAWEIYVTEAISHSTNRLTFSPKGGGAHRPSWSPEGDRVAFEANYRPDGTITPQPNLLALPSVGGTASLLVEDGQNPAW